MPILMLHREQGSGITSGMRVVILERNAEIRDKLHRAIENSPLFVLVGVVDSWAECRQVIEDELAEVVIASPELIPWDAHRHSATWEFPVIVTQKTGTTEDRGWVIDSSNEDSIRQGLHRIADEVIRRKAQELSFLVERYLAGANASAYVSALKVQDDDTVLEIPVDHVLSLAAFGNYVRVHTANRTYETRDTMTHIATKLDPDCFARVHRSYIVNFAHVYQLVQDETTVLHLVLSNGMQVPVGPNYRTEISQRLNDGKRLIA